jgi:hypothetical protein
LIATNNSLVAMLSGLLFTTWLRSFF